MALKNKDGRSVLVDADRVFSQGRFASSNSTDSGLARSRDSLGSLAVGAIGVAGIGIAIYQVVMAWFSGISFSLRGFYEGLDVPYVYIYEFYAYSIMYSIGLPVDTTVKVYHWLFNWFMSPYISYPLAIIGTFYFAAFLAVAIAFVFITIFTHVKARYIILAYLAPFFIGVLWYGCTSILALFS